MSELGGVECFVIMPISNQKGYPDGHFGHVYNELIKPSCEKAGYKPVRADDVRNANLIHLDILTRLVEAPMAVCDLSSQNPNVLFELGIRQAFDKPVVLIKDEKTPFIFDIAGLRCMEYFSDLRFGNVVDNQLSLKEVLIATRDAENDASNVNSIVNLLGLKHAAQIPDVKDNKESLELNLILSEIKNIKGILDLQGFTRADSETLSDTKGKIGLLTLASLSARAEDAVTSSDKEKLAELADEMNALVYDGKVSSTAMPVLKSINYQVHSCLHKLKWRTSE